MYTDTILDHFHVHNLHNYTRYIRIDCPLCEHKAGKIDESGKMHVFTDTWIAHCYRCNTHTHIRNVLSFLGIDVDIQLDSESVETLLDKITAKPVTPTLRDPYPVEMPDGSLQDWEPFVSSLPLRPFISELNRWGVLPDTAITFRWCWNQSRHSIIFPWLFEGEIVHWSERGDRKSVV